MNEAIVMANLIPFWHPHIGVCHPLGRLERMLYERRGGYWLKISRPTLRSMFKLLRVSGVENRRKIKRNTGFNLTVEAIMD